MKFEEFKNLVKERKRLKRVIALNLESYRYGAYYLEGEIDRRKKDLEDVEVQLEKNATKDYGGDFADIDFRLEREMTVSSSEFRNAIKKYFKDIKNVKDVCFDLEDYPLDWYLIISGKAYKLIMDSDDITLSVLYTDEIADKSKELIEDYPDLEEVMWELVEKAFAKVYKEKESKLIRRMTIRNNELKFLQDEKAIKKRIEELTNLNAEDEECLETLKKTSDEVNY